MFDEAGRLLLIRRAQAPSAGSWSVPGGRCRASEAPAVACAREVREETGLVVSVLRWAGRVERVAPSGGTYVIDDFVCAPISGTVHAGDDASDARWVTLSGMGELELAPGLQAALARWQLLPED